jgi:hypothetical protein
METSASEYVSFGFRIAGYKLLFETQVADQPPHGCRKSRALRPGLEKKAVSSDCSNQAAGAFRSFQKPGMEPQLLQAVSASQARDSRADYYHFFFVSQVEQSLSNWMKSGTCTGAASSVR